MLGVKKGFTGKHFWSRGYCVSTVGLDSAWQKIGSVNRLVQRITSPGYDQNAADHEIEEFASKQEPQRNDRMLTLLFAGVLDVLNDDRSKMIKGIIRYSRGQTERANRLGDDLNEMARIEEDSSAGSQKRLEALREQMVWQQRIFDEREEFIPHLCSRPVLIEQRLGFLARSIASYLE